MLRCVPLQADGKLVTEPGSSTKFAGLSVIE